MKHILLILITLLFFKNTFSQTETEQELITLTNGCQYMGYIIEMQPGKSIKMYRPIKKDTVNINVEDIVVRSLIIASISRKINSDSILKRGRFNNKLNYSQFSISSMSNFWEYDYLVGLGYTYSRNFDNKYYFGISTSLMGNFAVSGTGWKDPNFSSGMYYSKDSSMTYEYGYNQRLVLVNMFENKINILYWRKQKRANSLLIGLNLGYVFDFSKMEGDAYSYKPNTTPGAPPPTRKWEYSFTEKYQGNFIFQFTLCYKVNTGNNCGFVFEPGCAFYNPKVYQSKKGKSYDYVYSGNSYIDTPLFLTGRIGFFF